MSREFAFGLIVLQALLSLSTASEFPYRGNIATDDAPIRSGPADTFYETDHLPSGTEIDVYAQEKDWLAIRPPAGSFSWVLARDVTATDSPNVVRVVRKGSRTRVGSAVSESRNVQYVRLQVGESLRLLDSEPGSDGVWVRVEPPSGEFRWIHRQYVSTKSPAADDPISEIVPIVDEPPAKVEIQKATFAVPVSESAGDGEPMPAAAAGVASTPAATPVDPADAKSRMKTEPIPIATPKPAPETQPANEPPVSDSAWISRGESTVTLPSVLTNSVEIAKPTITDYDAELQSISLDLSSQVTRDSAQWDLADLRQRAEHVIDSAGQSQDRSRARELLKRISEFEDVQRKTYQLTDKSAAPTTLQDRPEIDAAAVESVRPSSDPVASRNRVPRSIVFATRTEPSTGQSPSSDNQGWLIPVATKRADLPKFALTDDDGGILQFVSPRAGLNLRPYLRQRVKVVGEVGDLPALGKPHLSVSRVVALSDK